MTETQKRTAMAIVNVFETGTVESRYGTIARIAGDPGHLSYGRCQASLASGNLYRLLDSYCRAPSAAASAAISPYLDRLLRRDPSLDGDANLCGALEGAALDPVMRGVQDRFFESSCFTPACAAAAHVGLVSPLAQTVVFDSFVQGGWERLRGKVVGQLGLVSPDVPEKRWVACYIAARREWLKSLGGVLANSTYRMDALDALVSAGKFLLELPLRVRGVTIDEGKLGPTKFVGPVQIAIPDENGRAA